MLGRYNSFKFTQEGWTNANKYYKQALQVEPNYALAYCGLADNFGWTAGLAMPAKAAGAKQKEMAEKALAIGLGDKGKALDWLEKSYEQQDSVCWYLKIDQITTTFATSRVSKRW